MGAWTEERDRALLALASAQSADARAEAANLLADVALDADARPDELTSAVPALLADPDGRVRRAGVALAARSLSEEEAERILSSRAADPDPGVRVEALGQLADLALPSSRATFAAALSDPEFGVRFEAARGMAALRHPAGLEILIEALGRGRFRFRALGALAELGDARAIPALQRVHRGWLVPGFERTQAAGALARLGDADAARWLLERTSRRRGDDRALAVELLGEVKLEGAYERLQALLADPKERVRGAAARGLGRLGDPRAADALGRVLEDAGAPEDVRLDAAEGLCLLGDPPSLARVEAAARGPLSPLLQAELRALLEEYRP